MYRCVLTVYKYTSRPERVSQKRLLVVEMFRPSGWKPRGTSLQRVGLLKGTGERTLVLLKLRGYLFRGAEPRLSSF